MTFLVGFEDFFFNLACLKRKTIQKTVSTHLLVEFQPCGETLCVLILESKVPNLPQANSLNNLQAQERIEGGQDQKTNKSTKGCTSSSGQTRVCSSYCKCSSGGQTHTWSNSCFPVVLGWMANSSSASIVVTLTLI